jgi:hypothetical protein
MLKPYQRVNHFPRSFLITKKDQLFIQLSRCQAQYGSGFDFVPESYCTPIGEEKRQRIKMALARKSVMIVKPSNSSRGRGIEFITKPEEVIIYSEA